MLAAVLAEGTTVIKNSAREPEIEDLQKYLNAIGGKVKGAGTGEIVVEGVKELHDCEEHSIMPDRIEAGTYMIASAATGGKVFVRNIVPSHVFSLSSYSTILDVKLKFTTTQSMSNLQKKT